jgi:hypothetical protein
VCRCLAPFERRLKSLCLTLTPNKALLVVAMGFAAAYWLLGEGGRVDIPHAEVQNLLRNEMMRQHGLTYRPLAEVNQPEPWVSYLPSFLSA